MPLGHHITDAWILTGVKQKLARHWVGAETDLTVTVRNGEVTLVGTLAHERLRRLLVRIAGGVTGVRSVVDQMHVAPDTPNGRDS